VFLHMSFIENCNADKLTGKQLNNNILFVSHVGILRDIYQYIFYLAFADDDRYEFRNAFYNISCMKTIRGFLSHGGIGVIHAIFGQSIIVIHA
jgi:hypothetical protein